MTTDFSCSNVNDCAYTLTRSARRVKGYERVSTIAHRLAEVRARAGLGVRPFAERVKEAGYPVSYGAVSNYEREAGPEKIPAGYLAAVCEAFRVSPEWLLLGVGPRERAGEDAESPARHLAADMLEDLAAQLRREAGAPAPEIPPEAFRPEARPGEGREERKGRPA